MDASDNNATVVLKPVGDVELWFLEASDCSWRLPVHVEWKEDNRNGNIYGLIIPGTCFYHAQLLCVNAVLGDHTLLEERTDRWLLPREQIESLLRKAPGIHAEFYYDWHEQDHAPIPSHHGMSVPLKRRAAKFGSFVEFIAAERGLPPDVVSVVLTAIGQVGPRWLLEYHQPIDLGFVQLMAVPFRANWKEIVMFKRKPDGLLKALLAPGRECFRLLSDLRFGATLCSVQNIALCGTAKHSRIDYTIEAVANEAFDRAVDQIEDDRAERGGYVARHSKAVEKLYDQIVDCLVRYAKKTQAAWAAVHHGSTVGSPTFVPSIPRCFTGSSLSNLPVHIVPTGNDFSVFAEEEGGGQRITLRKTPAKVPKVSAVPSTADDVRPRGGDGDVAEPRPRGTNGVPVLDAGQGAGAGQPMLPCGSTETWCPPRMGTE